MLEDLFSAFGIRQKIHGLEISDSALRFAQADGDRWQMLGERLAPGTVEGGKVKQRAEFVAALKKLREQIGVSRMSREKTRVVVAVSSANIYTQAFRLPTVKGEGLENAIQLNMQMFSPEEASKVYSSWHLVGEDTASGHLEILSAFMSRELVQEFISALGEAGFVVHAIEWRAVALARLMRMRTAPLKSTRPVIVFVVDSNGLEFLVVRHGELYFQYFTPWKDLHGSERVIPYSAFEGAIARSLHQVLNFSSAHWPEPLEDIFIMSAALKEKIEAVLKDNFSLTIRPFEVQMKQPVNPRWFVAVGSALRGFIPPKEDKGINLLGVSVQEEFRREQMIRFLHFWRLAIPLAMGALLAIFLAADLFLRWTQGTLEAHPAFRASQDQAQEMRNFQNQVAAFNQEVAFIKKITSASPPKVDALDELNTIVDAHTITLVRFNMPSANTPASFIGRAKSEDQILRFKKALDDNPRFTGVSLSLSDIHPDPQGLSFSLMFSIAAPKTP